MQVVAVGSVFPVGYPDIHADGEAIGVMPSMRLVTRHRSSLITQ
jgi:hypothetical protein